jgi:putative nucleotidyltransferase with HDIG domain
MTRLEELAKRVSELYNSKEPSREEWTDWLYENHVLVVAAGAKKLAQKYGANTELAEVAALLHDIADYKMKREDVTHEEESLKIARELMTEFGYTADETKLTVDDAVRYHSCHGDQRPKSKEGLVLATADSLAHLKTDFYVFVPWALGRESTLQEVKDWVLKKIDRDLYNKISFDEEREDARPDYETVKRLFSR